MRVFLSFQNVHSFLMFYSHQIRLRAKQMGVIRLMLVGGSVLGVCLCCSLYATFSSAGDAVLLDCSSWQQNCRQVCNKQQQSWKVFPLPLKEDFVFVLSFSFSASPSLHYLPGCLHLLKNSQKLFNYLNVKPESLCSEHVLNFHIITWLWFWQIPGILHSCLIFENTI